MTKYNVIRHQNAAMLFKELPKGKIFTYLSKDGRTETAIKSGDRHAIILTSGEEVKIHLTKKVENPPPIRGGVFAIDHEGRPMIAERLRNGSYACEYIERIGREVLAESQVSIINQKEGNLSESQNELYITLSRLEKSLKNAQNALELGKSIVEDLE